MDMQWEAANQLEVAKAENSCGFTWHKVDPRLKDPARAR